ncbi:hypothetical protein KR084_004533 [Drosophila pseudotakahashii]|nr:hypothetical protein KR084_004533 [Drosophila pseudotakahashii]
MGRAKVIRKPHLRRPLRDRTNPEDFYWTQEEVKQSIRRWSFLWEPISESDSEGSSLGDGKPLLKELSAYGDWSVPEGKAYDFETTGREILKNLSNFPFPEMILPPVSLNAVLPKALRVNRPPYITHTIFEHVLPDLFERALKLSNPVEPEGAVGYDRRYYDSPKLIRCLCSRPEPRRPPPMNLRGDSWMYGLRCARLMVELNAPLVDYARLPRAKNTTSRRNKLLKGLRKIKKSVEEGEGRSSRWMRPRVRIILYSESEWEKVEQEQQELWEVEEQLPSEYYYVEYANEELNSGDVDVEKEVETEQSWHSSEEPQPKITRSQSDLTLEYLKTSPMLRRSHSLSNLY